METEGREGRKGREEDEEQWRDESKGGRREGDVEQ